MKSLQVCALALAVGCSAVWAEEEPPQKRPIEPAPMESDLPQWMIPGVSHVHYGLSGFVDSTSRSIDRFFGTDDSLFVDNQSYLRIRQETAVFENRTSNDLSVRFRLDLPTTRKRLRLLIENEADDLRDTATSQQRANRFLDRQLNGNNNSGLGLEQVGTGDGLSSWKNNLGVGVRVRSDIDPYIRVTSQRRAKFADDEWQVFSFNRVTYFDKRGLVGRTTLDLNHPFTKTESLRFVTQGEWTEERKATAFSQSAEINQVLDSRTGLRYALIALGDTARQKNVFDYVAQVYWRRDIHQKFVFLDVVPEYHMPTEPNIDNYWALIFRIEVFFGKTFGANPDRRFASPNPF